ncbi:HAD hydrolase family protein [bacterium]|nr:HAD hydrolase family protein [bacterium]
MQDKLSKIKIVCFDCDGVLTDGKITYLQTENNAILEQKSFSAKDGMGVMMLHRAGLITAVITGRSSEVLKRRCADLNIRHLYQNIDSKGQKMQELLNELKLDWENLAYIGDDWNDYPVLSRAGFAATPNDGDEAIKPYVDFIAKKEGGKGAVREIIDIILDAQGLYEKAIEKFTI